MADPKVVKQILDEQKILEWCGFKWHRVYNEVWGWFYPEGGSDSDIALDMNFFFKYVVPKLSIPVIISIYNGETEVVFPSCFPDANTPDEDFMSPPLSVTNKDTNLAWQEALTKLIEK